MRVHDDPAIENPELLLTALERTSDAVVIVDGDLSVCYFNAAAERIWKLNRTVVLGSHVSALGLGDLQEHLVAMPDPE